MDVVKTTLFLGRCFLASLVLLCVFTLHLLLKLLSFYFFPGDLTGAMQTSLPGEMPAPADLDLARVGLDAGSKALLLMGGAGPSAPSCSGAKGLIVSFSLFYLLLCFGVSEVSFGFLFRKLCGYTKWVGRAPPCCLYGDRRLIATFASLVYVFVLCFTTTLIR
jgi:hypothetical protein